MDFDVTNEELLQGQRDANTENSCVGLHCTYTCMSIPITILLHVLTTYRQLGDKLLLYGGVGRFGRSSPVR